eukprot:2196427-Pyramimonas_sp.AAC.1
MAATIVLHGWSFDEDRCFSWPGMYSALFTFSSTHECGVVYDHMKAAEVPANKVTYSMLISACEKGGQWQKAWVSTRPYTTLHYSKVTYSMLISACEKGEQWQKAWVSTRPARTATK